MRLLFSTSVCVSRLAAGPPSRSLTIAVNAGVEGTALKTAAKEWGSAHGVHIEVVELPYANLFEKEQLDLTSHTGAYDVIMLDDPWFPRMVQGGSLAPLPREPDADFVTDLRRRLPQSLSHRRVSTRCPTWEIRNCFSIAGICSPSTVSPRRIPGRRC